MCSGVNKVSDLQFIDGELDMNFIYDRIMYRSNIVLEILIVREAVLPYKEYLPNIDRLPNVPVVKCKPKTKKECYVVFRNTSWYPCEPHGCLSSKQLFRLTFHSWYLGIF